MSIWQQQCVIAPSLISCSDMYNFERTIRELEAGGTQLLHVDILDGHFSPSMPLGLDTVRAIRKITDMPFDVHLMASQNDYFVEELLQMGVDQLVFHAETEEHIQHRLDQIHAHHVRAGVALKPSTPLSVLDYALDECDAVLLMLINPGYASSGAEAQVSYAARKVKDLHERIEKQNPQTRVILDGRISRQNILDYGVTGQANIFVAGSTCLKKMELTKSIVELHEFVHQQLEVAKHE